MESRQRAQSATGQLVRVTPTSAAIDLPVRCWRRRSLARSTVKRCCRLAQAMGPGFVTPVVDPGGGRAEPALL